MDVERQPIKAHKTSQSATARRSARHNVLHLETVMQHVLAGLPLPDLQTFLSVCGDARELAWLWKDAPLWDELLTQHFGGRRCIPAEAQADDQEAGDNGFDAFGGGNDDEEEDEEEADDRSDSDEDDEDDEDAEPATASSTTVAAATDTTTPVVTTATTAPPPAASTATAEDASETQASATATTVLPSDLPAYVQGACDAAREFAASLTEWLQFHDRVVVLRADIYTIQDVNGHAIDAIAFPGDSSMRNPRIGAAGAMFRRAGNELDSHTSRLSTYLQAGQCHVTPGFNSGARVLIHCHGPYNSHPRLFLTLAKTYRNVLRKAKEENVECLALTSISTGNFGVPVPEASRTAMQAIQQFMRAHHEWQGRVGIVCYEPDVFEAFRNERQRVLDSFNVTLPQ